MEGCLNFRMTDDGYLGFLLGEFYKKFIFF